jgi:hypothetical protein
MGFTMMYPPFSCYRSPRHFWFRLFGFGVVIKDVRVHPLLFSERTKRVRCWRIGWLHLRVLTP